MLRMMLGMHKGVIDMMKQMGGGDERLSSSARADTLAIRYDLTEKCSARADESMRSLRGVDLDTNVQLGEVLTDDEVTCGQGVVRRGKR